ncbi:hypothetical protein HY024_00730 [Candidatus Curtissbacteria bacterium]|nr:hypothetical protein [Candidatus Curtissbacteria bacterium]
MKQLSLTELTSALSDDPKTIGERLEILGITKEDTAGKIPDDALGLTVYGSSFLKFLQDNASKLEVEGIPAEKLPADYVNPFDEKNLTIGERLKALDIKDEDVDAMFSAEALSVNVSGNEFQDFILQNQEKFLSKIQELALADAGGES